MKGRPIIAVLWNDHVTKIAQDFPENDADIDDELPTLTVGILLRETDKYLVIVHDAELGSAVGSYSKILKTTIISMKTYGKIKIKL